MSVAEGAKRTLVAAGELPDKVGVLGQSLLAIAGATPVPRAGIASLAGIDLLTHIVLFAVVFYSSFKLARLAPDAKVPDAAGASVANAFLFSFAIVAFLYTFTDLSVNVETSRYFVPSLALGLISMLTWLDRQWSRAVSFGFLVAAFAALLVGALSFRIFLWPLYSYYKERNWEMALPATLHEGLLHFLEDNNLSYGYAFYWNANVNTVLSGGRVTIRPVQFRSTSDPFSAPCCISRRRTGTGSAERRRDVSRHNPNESKEFDLRRLESTAGPARRTLNYAGYTIYVFPGDLGERLFGWDPTFAHRSTLRYNETTFHQMGDPRNPMADLSQRRANPVTLHTGPIGISCRASTWPNSPCPTAAREPVS